MDFQYGYAQLFRFKHDDLYWVQHGDMCPSTQGERVFHGEVVRYTRSGLHGTILCACVFQRQIWLCVANLDDPAIPVLNTSSTSTENMRVCFVYIVPLDSTTPSSFIIEIVAPTMAWQNDTNTNPVRFPYTEFTHSVRQNPARGQVCAARFQASDQHLSLAVHTLLYQKINAPGSPYKRAEYLTVRQFPHTPLVNTPDSVQIKATVLVDASLNESVNGPFFTYGKWSGQYGHIAFQVYHAPVSSQSRLTFITNNHSFPNVHVLSQ